MNILTTYKFAKTEKRPLREDFTSNKSQLFLFSNENVRDSLGTLGDLRGKTVLSVGASGDHAFEAYLSGARRVDLFDINPYQKLVVELKHKMIKKLDFAEFRKCFAGDFADNRKILRKLYPEFSMNLISLLQGLYNSNNNSTFTPWCLYKPGAPQNISYLTCATEYERLRNILPKKLEFKTVSLDEIPHKFSQRYDCILLSNIFDYFWTQYDITSRFNDFYHEVLLPIAEKNLVPFNSQIMFHYCFDWNRMPGLRNEMDTANFPKYSFHYARIPSVTKHAKHDMVCIMETNMKTKSR